MSYVYRYSRGIPVYIRTITAADGSTQHIALTFEVAGGKPALEHCIELGPYDPATDTIQFRADWEHAVQSRLDAYRAELEPKPRATLRETIDKPEKQRHSRRTSGRTATKRTKAVANCAK